MSFSQDVKKEIADRQVDNPCCVTAACYGIACFGKYFDARGVVLHTERAYIAQWAKAMFAKAGVQGKVYVRGEGKNSYEFSIKDPYEVEKMLALFAHSGDETTLRLKKENLNCENCFAAFVAAAFLCAGIVVNPEKGYALEYVSPRYSLLRDFEALLKEHGFAGKYALRNGYHVLYFKASEQIEDLLTTMGASRSALEIMNLKVYKDLRNRANRITNCETANIDKAVAAGRQVLLAIAALEKAGALQALPEPLQEAAALRKAHPALSLGELVEISLQPTSKASLSRRYRKICDIADEMKLGKAE